jgi:hypothetical protein
MDFLCLLHWVLKLNRQVSELFEATRIADSVLEQCRADDFGGHDPFDGLNSTLFARLGGNSFSLARIAWLQLHKRSPLNLRRLVGIPAKRNPKGIALIILGLMERRKLGTDSNDLNDAVELGDWLLTQSVDRRVWKHHAWGYHFDWAARAFYVPRGKPNAITTCYVSRALHKLGLASGHSRFIEAATDAGLFIDGLYMRTPNMEYYAYIPGETAFVHNASLWSAAVVCQTAALTGDEALRDRALRVARQSASMQQEDGHWRYGVRNHHAFVDGFHTGYNLEALDLIQKVSGVTEFAEAIIKGLDYYRNNFFLPDGTVKYYNDCVWPMDTHSVAQAVVTLIKVGRTNTDLALANAVLQRAYASLYLIDKKRFVYQKGRWITNRINYLRWTQAWAFYALCLYAAQSPDDTNRRDETN